MTRDSLRCILALAVAASLVACGGDGTSDPPGGDEDTGSDMDTGADGSDDDTRDDTASPDTATDASDPDPIELTCTPETCPELVVAGDPIDHDCLRLSPCFVRGMYDPSLEYDPATDVLWLAYSSGSGILADPGVASSAAAAHRTHLARSEDHGQTWQYVAELNPAIGQTHPTTSALGVVQNEIPTLGRRADGSFELVWLEYFETIGNAPERTDLTYARKVAPTPPELAAAPITERWRGAFPFRLGPSMVLGDLVPELADCAVLTEPGVYMRDGVEYLVTFCLAFNASHTDIDYTLSRNVLLAREADGYRFIGDLLDHDDARAFGGDSLEQAAIADSRTPGRVLLVVTPIDHTATVPHLGCVVLEIEDLATASVRRGQDGRPAPRATILGWGNQLGPGLCDYDPMSETGVLLTIPFADLSGAIPDIRIAVRATGVHP